MNSRREGNYFYDLRWLRRWFAFSSVLLLLATIWMIWDDHHRPFKDYQREFFRLDAGRARAALRAEEEKLEREGRLKELEAELARAERDLSSRGEELSRKRSNLKDLEARLHALEFDLNSSRAVLDTRRYEFEKARETHGRDHPRTASAGEVYRRSREVAETAHRAYQAVLAERDAAREELEAILSRREELETERKKLTSGIEIQRRRLKRLRRDLASRIRNWPILDFANPSIKVRQIVLRHFQRDYHFADVFRVDRCISCHAGIDRHGFEDAPQPFTSHPRLDLYLTSLSPHPMDEFGCTICHAGKGRATDFVSASHTPGDEGERSRWIEEYGWHRLEHWEYPMLPGKLAQSACFKCHREEDQIPGAELYNEGKVLYENLGCANCHRTEGFLREFRKIGPDLTHLTDKVTPEWAFRWIKDPLARQPTTRMPVFYGLSNNSDPESLARGDVEIRALVTYLSSRSTGQELVDPPPETDADAGKRLFWTVGCVACHVVEDPTDPGKGGRDRGPNLSTLGSKTNPRWLFNWIRDPRKHFPDTLMPGFRLTDQEASNIAAYLMERKGKEDEPAFPPLDEKLLESMVVEKLMERSTEARARERVRSMDNRERLIYLGDLLLGHYGCSGCHVIPGQDSGLLVGRDFTGQDAVADKPMEQVAFGFTDIPHTWHDWLRKKLEDPRIFDRGFERRPADKLRMPWNRLTPDQREALVCFLLSITNEKVPHRFLRRFRGPPAAIRKGEPLVRQLNCRSCHLFTRDRLVFADPGRGRGREGEIPVRGVVSAVMEDVLIFQALEDREVGDLEFLKGEMTELEKGDWLRWERKVGGDSQEELLWFYAAGEEFGYERREVESGDQDAAIEWYNFRAAHQHMLPPPLEGEGARVQPDWLYRFLEKPFPMRLQLEIQMPDFRLKPADAGTLAEYFCALDGADFPFLAIAEQEESYREAHREEILKARELFDSQEVNCIRCHIRGTLLPDADRKDWGPDLSLTPGRLRPAWMLQWLQDPQLLQPGTKMPTYTDFTPEDRRAMKDFMMNFQHFYPKKE